MANKKTNTKAAKENAQVKTESNLPSIDVKISSLRSDGSHFKANASVNIGGAFAVHGISVVEGKNGLFVTMPQRSYTDMSGEKKYNDVFHSVSKEAHDALNKAVLDAYQQALGESEDETESEEEDLSDDGESEGFVQTM
jgi:stage V sporulation protein G